LLGISKENSHNCYPNHASALVSKATRQKINLNLKTTGAEYHRYSRNSIERISTGSSELDNLLREV
jgi:RecA/RadA recombinase